MEILEKITEDLYIGDLTKEISVNPFDIGFGRYYMPNTLNHSEYEDVGARLVEAARDQGQWVGISYKMLTSQLGNELKLIHEESKREENGFLAQAYTDIKSLVTGKPPVEKAEKKEAGPVSVLALTLSMHDQNGLSNLITELNGMADKGYLDLVEQDNQAILFPTQKFAETVYEAQRSQK